VGNSSTLAAHPIEVPCECPDAGLIRGFTVADLATRLRVSPDKVRSWINRGELKAVNTATVLCARPRWVVTPEALEEFEKARRGGPAPKPQRGRRRKAQEVDFYPD
jgi:hypothetical protein